MPLHNYIWWGYPASDGHCISVRICQPVCTCQQGPAALSTSWYIYIYTHYSWDDQKYVGFLVVVFFGGRERWGMLKVKKT